MRIQRTANAGVLLELDGIKILLDGVCREVFPYPATPSTVKESLQMAYPDIVAMTHFHDDHCDMTYNNAYEWNTDRRVITPEHSGQTFSFGNIRLSVVKSRHIGRADCDHVSFLIEGSKRIWFMGDASPNQWRRGTPKADVLIAPYAYATTESAWRISREIAPNTVILHLPDADNDVIGLRDAVRQTVGEQDGVFIPEMEEFIQINF